MPHVEEPPVPNTGPPLKFDWPGHLLYLDEHPDVWVLLEPDVGSPTATNARYRFAHLGYIFRTVRTDRGSNRHKLYGKKVTQPPEVE